MLCVRPRPPVDYSKCNQTVTIYHQNADKSVTRTVCANAFIDLRKNQNINETGATETNSFLLVIPGASLELYVGDKVFLGTGPQIITWASYIPATVPGLVVIKYVDPKYWQGEQCHVEAGG